ncbi:MAG: holo-ACP synthase [Propionibacteriaceae bacterium]|nr:holo-ACP synthase [Propionibacteriaceae bacterium]
MIVGIGTDVVDLARWERLTERSPGVVAKVLTPAEAATRLESQAARFAAKEALAKALGCPRGLDWQDCEVVATDSGRPTWRWTGTIAAQAAALGVTRSHLTLSHDAGVAVAFTVLEDDA